MKSFFDLIKKRRSIRKFTDQLLTPEEVELLMKAALMSPASKSSNPWQFILVENKETLQKLSKAKTHGGSLIADSVLAIVVIADPLKSDVWIEDASIVSTFIQLQAEDMGLGSCWVQIRCRTDEDGKSAEQNVRDILNIPYQMEVLSIIAIGHKAQEKSPFNEENLQWEKIHIENFKIRENESQGK